MRWFRAAKENPRSENEEWELINRMLTNEDGQVAASKGREAVFSGLLRPETDLSFAAEPGADAVGGGA